MLSIQEGDPPDCSMSLPHVRQMHASGNVVTAAMCFIHILDPK